MTGFRIATAFLAVCLSTAAAMAERPMSIDDLAKIRHVTSAAISPDGALTAYTVTRTRDVIGGEYDNSAEVHLYVASAAGDARMYIEGDIRVSNLAWSPDGSSITFIARRARDDHALIYEIPRDGGEARAVFAHGAGIHSFAWAPDGETLYFIARDAADPVEDQLIDKGFGAKVYEETARAAHVWRVAVNAQNPEAVKLNLPGHASALSLSPNGARLAVALAPTPLVDDFYMERDIVVVDLNNRATVTARFETPGKIGPFRLSPDGENLAFIAAVDRADPTAGTLMIGDADTGAYIAADPEAEAHAVDVGWWGDDAIAALVHRGVASELALFGRDGSEQARVEHTGFVGRGLTIHREGERYALIADAPTHPRELWLGAGLGELDRWTDHNAWLDGIELFEQSVVRYEARDGIEIEGLLITPKTGATRAGFPMIIVAHGGPEAHYSNGWLTRYADPGQIGAGQGFAMFYPNYRGSTGRGTAFAKLDHLDGPGDEFYDLVDAIDHFELTVADPRRIGITGGSYGGFASAWGATIASEHFAASVAFVSMTNLVSFMGTTDIPVEMVDVHFMQPLWEDPAGFLEASPVYHAGKSQTPTLILHGEADPRVHPAQSLELYRQLKQQGGAPVRLVTYPGEGHGNRRAAAQYDYAQRLMRWMTHYLKGPGGEPPAPDWGVSGKTRDRETARLDRTQGRALRVRHRPCQRRASDSTQRSPLLR